MEKIDALLKKDCLDDNEIAYLSENLPKIDLVKEQVDLIWIHLNKLFGTLDDISGILLSLKKWYGDTNFIVELQSLWASLDFGAKDCLVRGVSYHEFLLDKEIRTILNLIIKYEKDKELLILLFILLNALNRSKKNRDYEVCSKLVESIKSQVNKIKYIFLRKRETELVNRINSSIKIFSLGV